MNERSSVDAALAAWSVDAGSVEAIGSGYINDTYRVNGDYLLQRVNAFVFDEPSAVVENQAKLIAATRDRSDAPPLARLIATDAGDVFYRSDEAAVWRLQPWLEGRNFDDLPDHLVAAAARSFGHFGRFFSAALATGQIVELIPTIPGFHDLTNYLARWDAVSVANALKGEAFRIDRLRGAFDAGRRDALIHGDCKVNNLLFHPERDEVIAILDLDTAMRGDSAWDFGDLARSVCTRAVDSASWWRRLELLCGGFRAGFGEIDVDHFAAAPAYMSFMLAIRFLTDHLEDDVYFKVDTHGDNLVRGQLQLDAAELFFAARESIAVLLDDG